MECPRGGSRAVQRAVQHAQHQGEPLAMERFNNQWYYGLRDENQALPPPPFPPVAVTVLGLLAGPDQFAYLVYWYTGIPPSVSRVQYPNFPD